MPLSSVMDFLLERKDFFDGVVISGGEPTIQPELSRFLGELKSIGYDIKLDTNGTRPENLKDLIKMKAVDYIAMDIKGPLLKYSDIVKTPVSLEDIKASIKAIMESGIPYEFRATLLPRFHSEVELNDMGMMVKGAEIFYVQQFNPKKTLDPSFQEEKTFTQGEIENLGEVIQPYVKKVLLR